MLKITHQVARANQTKPTSQPIKVEPESKSEPKPMRSMEELLQIKERIEVEMEAERQHNRQTMAEMFLAGPLAWPDYPESEDLDWSELDEDEDEEWIPLDCLQDSQFRSDSSNGEK